MSNIIKISRNSLPEASREIALIALSETSRIKHYAGQLVMSSYYTNYEELGESSPIDAIIVIGVSEGYGSDHFKVISLGAGKIVRGIRKGSENIPDASECVNDEIWLWQDDDDVCYFVYNSDSDATTGAYSNRKIEPIGTEESYHVINAEDNSNWYYHKGVLRSDYNYYTQEEITEFVTALENSLTDLKASTDEQNAELLSNLESFQSETAEKFEAHDNWLTDLDNEVYPLEVSIGSSEYQYLAGTTAYPILTFKATRKGENVTSECTYALDGEDIEVIDTQYTISAGLTETTTLTGAATYVSRGIVAEGKVVLDFGYYFWHGNISKGYWEPSQYNIFNLTKTVAVPSTSESFTVSGITSSEDQRYAFVYPVVYGELSGIYDQNGFDLTAEFEKVETLDLVISGVGTHSYYVYTKTASATFDQINLTFNY